MSGGVDSGTVAAYLKHQGHEVIGITMRLYSGPSHCCGTGDVEDARRTAAHLGIPFYVLNYEKEFSSSVIDKFVSEYTHGRTPNPCILCNQNVKFDDLLSRAESLGANYLATGHYGQIEYDESTKKYQLKKAQDDNKDQSYVLFSMTQKQLAKTIFPLGGFSKPQTRAMAKEWNLPVADKAESQDICFVPDKDYASFVEKWLGKTTTPLPPSLRKEGELKGVVEKEIPPEGELVDTQGNVLGTHRGVHHYTIGQRSGLGIATKNNNPFTGQPVFVTEIDVEKNQVVVGTSEETLKSECLVTDVNWISGETPEHPIPSTVKIRYKHQGAEALVIPQEDKSVIVRFTTRQRAITPGQAAVFYNEDIVLGGGWIKKIVQ